MPLCPHHLARAVEFAQAAIAEAKVAPPRNDVVYYLRVGHLLKIGQTCALRRRLREYPPDTVLLAVERGDKRVERRRLQQFAKLRADRREWFYPGEALLDHVETLRAQAVAEGKASSLATDDEAELWRYRA